MLLSLTSDRLLPGTDLKGDLLSFSPEAGGLSLPELKGEGPRWLNLKMTVHGRNAQAFELRLYAEEDAPRIIIRFGMMPEFRSAVALDLNWLDGHILFPGHRVGTQKIVCHGSRIRREEITRAELIRMPGTAPLQVTLTSLALEDKPCPVEMPSEDRWIDSFGQLIPREWDRKIHSEAELVSALREEAGQPSGYPDARWTPWGGRASRKLREGTGFFSRIRKDGRWYLTDPSGCAFFSLGPDCVVVRCDARVDGLESLVEDLPSEEEHPELWETASQIWGETPRSPAKLFSFERANLQRAFGTEWNGRWQKMIIGQLQRMGMNTLGNWSDPALWGRMPYVMSLPEFPATSHLIFRDFPDVLSGEYRREAKRCARALRERREDPWMIGYFLRNEPAWAFVDDLIIADEVLRDPVETACRQELLRWLEEKYKTPEALSAAWQHSFRSFEELRRPLEKASALSSAAREDLRAFSGRLTEAYMRIPAEACRAEDPNHMILGMRWAWISDPLLVSGWDCFDVFSINCYAVDPTPALDRIRELGVDLPVMIGEFHFGALDAALPATGLEAVASQADRARAFRYYCERAAAHPQGVGCHWFQCYDQFALGRFDGENYNIGLFDITLRPFPELKAAVLRTAERVDAVHAGEEAPSEDKPESLPMIAY